MSALRKIGGWLLAIAVLASPAAARAQAGFVDTSFLNGLAGPNSWVWAMALQPDGKLLVGGQFTSFDGVPGGEVVRLNVDGSVDTNFSGVITAGEPTVHSLAWQPDGKVLVGGMFSGINGVPRTRLARLNGDGTVDSNFTATVTGGSFVTVSLLALQTNGQVVIGGWFDTVNGVASANIARLNSDGTLDTNFVGGLDSPPNALTLQADGKVLIGGAFSLVDGVAIAHVARLNTDGTLDTNFLLTVDGNVDSFAVQTDGKIVIGGGFTNVNGFGRKRIARVNSNGTVDSGFQNGLAGANDYVGCVALDPGGKVIVGGQFTAVNGVGRTNVARLNTNGSLDSAFVADVDSFLERTVVQPDSRVIILGSYITSVNGRSRNRLARLQNSTAPIIFNFGSAAGGVSFDVAAVAGVTYGVQASTNLINWNTVLTTNAVVDGFSFIDGSVAQFPQRFFRVFR